uniref:Putative hexapeptide repeat-containing transferase n=1 Tax=viral metagenome TaxID=1070528 RepID=A0A6M3IPK3_9ZZZZ
MSTSIDNSGPFDRGAARRDIFEAVGRARAAGPDGKVGVAPYKLARSGDISWTRHPRDVSDFGGSILLGPHGCAGKPRDGLVVLCGAPRTAMAVLLQTLGDQVRRRPRVLGSPIVSGIGLCAIGGDGFGLIWEPTLGGYIRFPHYGSVVFGEDVHLGDGVVINCGCLGDTVIGNGARIDSRVFIAHGAQIGEHAVLVAGCIICGSAKIGARAWIGPGACVLNGVAVGERGYVGAMANVLRNVPPGEVWAGNPARKIRMRREDE